MMGHAARQTDTRIDIARQPNFSPSIPPLLGLDTVDWTPESLADADQSLRNKVMSALGDKNFAQAIDLVRAHIKLNPKNADLHNLWGALHLHQKEAALAKIALKKADTLRAGDPKILNNLACAAMQVQDYTGALKIFVDLARTELVRLPQIYYNMALCYYNVGQIDNALITLGKADQLARLPDTYVLRALIFQDQGHSPQAEQELQEAAKIYPQNPNVLYHLSSALFSSGHLERAFSIATDLFARYPDNAFYGVAYAHICQMVKFYQYDSLHAALVEKLLTTQNIDIHHIENMWETFLAHAPIWRQYFNAVDGFDLAMADGAIDTLKKEEVLTKRFLIDGLRVITVRDTNCEIIFTKMRHAYLCRIAAGTSLDTDDLLFISALASQCQQNEYVYYISAEEEKLYQDLKEQSQKGPLNTAILLVLCLYGPLTDVISPAAAEGLKDNPYFAVLIKEQITQKQREFDLMKKCRTLTPIENETSLAVEQMYLENPYPQWRNINFLAPLTQASGPKNKAPRSQVLIAGCGTGKHALESGLAYENTDVLAIDLSRRSLAYAMRKTQEFGITHITYAQADILELGTFNKKFDLIECVGVLHHLKEPEKGLAVLTKLLKPGGLLRLGLYSELARQPIVVARDILAQGGYPTTPQGIRAFRHDVIENRKSHPAAGLLMRRDFFSMSTCRDLVFHVQEHRYTIPQIKKMLADHQLDFRFFSLAPSEIAAFNKEYPHPDDSGKLDLWAEFEEKYPLTFKKMYQFWVQKPVAL